MRQQGAARPVARRISIVVPTRNRASSLAETLMCVARLQIPGDWAPELLIVDNGSSDGTADVAARARISGKQARVLYEPLPGVSRARNRGSSDATGEVILFLDDDVRPPETWMTGLAAPIIAGGAAATVSQFRLGLDRPWLTDSDRAAVMSELSIDPAHPFLVGGSMGIRRDLLMKLGGFDEEIGPGALGPGGEDLLLTCRVRATGGQIAFVPDVEVLHLPDERKLEQSELTSRRTAQALSEAWLAYHWFGRSDRCASAKAALLLAISKLPLHGRETGFAIRAAWHRQMAIEQRRDRKYSHEARAVAR